MKNKFCIMVTMSIAILLPQAANAVKGVIPGKSLLGISLGIPRQQAVSILNNRLKDFQTAKVHGFIDDSWNDSKGHNVLEMISKNGKVVQLSITRSDHKEQTDQSFAQLNQKYHLSKSVCAFDDEGSGWVGYFYDDKKLGICYSLGVQDDFLLTYKPESIIIHKPNSSVIPIMGGIYGKKRTGKDAAAYANESEARKADEASYKH